MPFYNKSDFSFKFHQDKKYGSPIISCYIENVLYNFILDTGASYNFLGISGIIKAYGSLENFTNIKKQNVSYPINEKQLLTTNVDSLIINNKSFNNVIFAINDNGNLKSDGVLGYTTFFNYKNITIDYKKSMIYLNSPAITKKDIPITLDENNLMQIPIKINGKDDFTYIDTGLDTAFDKIFF